MSFGIIEQKTQKKEPNTNKKAIKRWQIIAEWKKIAKNAKKWIKDAHSEVW